MVSVKKAKSDFSLSKWYLDCIDVDGNVFIGYSAVLRWKRYKLNYANILRYNNACGLQTETTLRRQPPPKLYPHCLKWEPSILKTQGTWHSIDKPIKKSLLTSDSGTLRWLCHQPKATANVLVRNNQKYAGLGYTEKLEMSIEPWELPISKLSWGRFLSKDDTIIWINWKGTEPLSLLFHQGKQMDEAIISDEQIIINQGEFILSFSDTFVLRKGSLISTALANIPGIKNLFPDKLLHTYECKWRSKGTLRNKSNRISEGWIIHEVVQWHQE
ncbi:MAG: hypothetical protein ACE5IW_12765 [bacterium]